MRSLRFPSMASELSPQRLDAYRVPPFSSVEQGIAAIEADGPQRLATDALREDLRWFIHVQRALEAVAARWLAELDRRQPAAPLEDPSSAGWWLQENLRLTSNAAYAQVRTARQLDDLPRTAAALRRGELSSQHVSVICRAMEEVRKTCMDPSGVEHELVEAGRRMDPRSLLRHWHQLRYQADQAAGLAAEEERRRRSWLFLRETWSGSYQIEGELDAESGAALKTALAPLMKRRSPDDERPPSERRAQSLGELARRRLDAGDLPERGGERPHLVLVADVATLRLEPGSRLAELNWGPLVTGETVRRIGCDAAITPVLVDGEGEILHVGRRTRSVPPRMRRALNLRDRHCQGPGCAMPAEDCVPHHLHHFGDDGPTELSNLRLYCVVCHAKLHPENDRFRRAP